MDICWFYGDTGYLIHHVGFAMMMTMLKPTKYPLRCPNCHSTESEMIKAGDRMENEGTRYPLFIRTLECEMCSLVWDETFRFVCWDKVEGPDEG